MQSTNKQKYLNIAKYLAGAQIESLIPVIGLVLSISLLMVVCGLYLLSRGTVFAGWASLGMAMGAVLFPAAEYWRRRA